MISRTNFTRLLSLCSCIQASSSQASAPSGANAPIPWGHTQPRYHNVPSKLLPRLLLLCRCSTWGAALHDATIYFCSWLQPHGSLHGTLMCCKTPHSPVPLSSAESLAGKLTPLRCAGRATFSFLVTGWPLFRPTARPFATMIASWLCSLPERGKTGGRLFEGWLRVFSVFREMMVLSPAFICPCY